jgi:hypothetical protein
MTLAQLRAKYGSGPRMACRPLQRHGIVQGQKQQRGPDGLLMFHPNGAPVTVDKIRLVDDSRRSLHNSHLIRTCETVAPCPFTYMAYVCDAVVFRLAKLVSMIHDQPLESEDPTIICQIDFANAFQTPNRQLGTNDCILGIALRTYDQGRVKI